MRQDKYLGGENDPRFEFVLDILDGCANHCPGCYVTRRQDMVEDDLRLVVELAEQFSQLGFNFDEFTLGPTDIYTSSNFEDVLSSPAFRKLMASAGLTASTTLMQTSNEQFLYRTDRLLHISEELVDIVMLVVIDVERLLNDPLYLSTYTSRLNYLYARGIGIGFLINYSGPDSLKGLTVEGILSILMPHLPNVQLDAPLKLVGAFFNAKKTSIVHRNYLGYKTVFEASYDPANSYVADIAFAHNSYRFLLKESKIYAVPYIGGAIALLNDDCLISDPNPHRIMASLSAKIEAEMQPKYKECQVCTWLPYCAENGIMGLRDHHQLTSCPVPFGGSDAVIRR